MAASDEIRKLNKDIADLRDQLGKTSTKSFLANEIEDARVALRGLKSELVAINSDLSFISDSFKNSVSELTKQNYFLNLSKSSLKGIVGVADKFLDVQRGNNELSAKEIINLQNRGDQLFRNLGFVQQFGDLQGENLGVLNNTISQQEVFNKGLQDAIKFQNKINKNSGVKIFSGLSDVAKAIPGLNKIAPGFQEAANAAKQQARDNEINVQLENDKYQAQLGTFNLEKQSLQSLSKADGLTRSKIKSLGLESKFLDKNGKILAGTAATRRANTLLANQIPPILGKAAKGSSVFLAGLKALRPILKQLLGPLNIAIALFQANKQVVELQKSLSLNVMEATELRNRFSNIAVSTGDINITSSKLLKTFSALNKQFGFITNFSDQTLVTATKLTEVVGISAEAANMLAANAEINGENFKDSYKTILGTSYELQRQNGIQFDNRQILEDVAKVSNAIRVSFAGSNEEIASAVTKAKLLGTSLSVVDGIASSLVDFESSITAELGAQVVTGRQLEFSRARLLANENRLGELAEELTKQLGSFTEFSKMGRIEQEMLAAAFGLSRDAASDLLAQQEIQNKSAKELRALGKEDLAQRLESQTAADKFNKTLEKLQDLLVDAVAAFTPLLEVLGFVFDIIGGITKLLSPIMGTISGIATGALIGGPPGAIIGGILGAASDVSRGVSGQNINSGNNSSAMGDIYSPPAGRDSMLSTSLGTSNDTVSRELKTTNVLLGQLVNTKGTIKIDSTNIGTGISLNSRQIQ